MENVKKLAEILAELKNHNMTGVKAEFEAEGATLQEAELLKEISPDADLTIKIGGAEAIKDMLDAKMLGAKTIVAPMIESKYAMQKFVNSAAKIFNDEKLFINIETITGYENFEEIITTPEFSRVDGIVLGRFDMAKSMNLETNQVNGAEILSISKHISQFAKSQNKFFIIGGRVCPKTLDFLSEVPYFTGFETRKIIFDAKTAHNNDTDGILKALEFEILWIENKKNYGTFKPVDEYRLKCLNKRLSAFSACGI